ncbi:hypothetical protein RM69_00295 [Mesotoga sp. SC_NapDC3]|nr:hypothetical protein RM69_00295 [Mesotoga sp. SC_NapDC3]PXF35588.1 hypothetical protein EU77_00850 [Mesotoga sp. SC_NapDC]
MKEAFVLLLLLFCAVSFAVVAIDPFTHTEIQITFPGEIRFLTYGNKPAVAVDISFYTDTMFLPRNIMLREIKILVLRFDERGDIVEVDIEPASYNSRLLNKVLNVNGEVIVPSSRKEGYRVPDTIAGFELESKKTETGSLLYYLPREWNLIWRLKWGNDMTNIFSDNEYIEISPYSETSIEDAFLKYKIMFPNLEKLYGVYRHIKSFEDMNNSLRNIW